MVGRNTVCSNCGAAITIQRQMQPLAADVSRDPNLLPLILGILSLIVWLIPIFTLPLPIVGIIMSYNRNYRLGIILNVAGLGVDLVWTIICILANME